jgi:predicted cupin superfamily sugar epimerase
MDAAYWIKALDLQPHPEGGWFRETYRARERLPAAALPARYGEERALATAILFLLEGFQRSALHRLRSDELWHFHAGSALTLHVIHPNRVAEEIRLGGDPEHGERFQALVPAGSWFGATVGDPREFSLVGCTVAPGFDFADFELGDRAALLAAYPEHEALVRRLTRTA